MKRTDYLEGKTPPKEKYEEPAVGDIVSFVDNKGPDGEFMVISKKVFPPEGGYPLHIELGIPEMMGSVVPDMVKVISKSPWISVSDLLPELNEVVFAADNTRPYKSGIQEAQFIETEEGRVWHLTGGLHMRKDWRESWKATHWMRVPPPPGQDREEI